MEIKIINFYKKFKIYGFSNNILNMISFLLFCFSPENLEKFQSSVGITFKKSSLKTEQKASNVRGDQRSPLKVTFYFSILAEVCLLFQIILIANS